MSQLLTVVQEEQSRQPGEQGKENHAHTHEETQADKGKQETHGK